MGIDAGCIRTPLFGIYVGIETFGQNDASFIKLRN
jgi:hypothetical protein